MYEEILSEIGMTKSEIAVYLSLLEIGISSTGQIIKKAKIASGKAYLVLNKLMQKGLVTYSIKSGVKHYRAKDPEKLIDYLKDKEKEIRRKESNLKKIIPLLKSKYEEKKYITNIEVYEGIKGLFTLYEFILKELKKGEILYVIGAPREIKEKIEGFLQEFNKKRIRKGIKLKIIYNNDCRDIGSMRAKMPFTEVKYMKQKYETPTWIDIFGNYIANMTIHGDPVCFLIQNKEAAESYKKYFEMMWGQAEA